VQSMFKAGTTNAALAIPTPGLPPDPAIISHPDFPTDFPTSAYAYLPGKAFDQYGAEQIANSVEHGEAAIVKN